MRGDPINPQTLNEELMRGVNRTNDYLRSPKVKNGARSFLRTLLNIIVFCLRLFVIFIVGAFIVATIVGIIAFIVASAEQPMNDNLASFIQFSLACSCVWSYLPKHFALCLIAYVAQVE